MKNSLTKALNNPAKALRYLLIAAKHRLARKKNVLIIIGVDPNGELDILAPGYKTCYVFEANPKRYEKLYRKHSKKSNIKLFNYAVADYDGEVELNISSNNEGASSSLGTFNPKWQEQQAGTNIQMIEKARVPCINLLNFCQQNNIDHIDDYISDIQGMDLQVLKTMQPMIENKKIGTIKCEVTKDEYGNIYEGLPDNSETGFKQLLEANYELVARGFGLLNDNQFDKIPESAWEMDCKWHLK